MIKSIFRLLTIAFVLGIAWYPATAQVSITTLGSPGAYTQDFDALGTGNFSLTDNTSIAGVYAFRASGNAIPNVFAASTGSTGTGEFKNYGSAGNLERCFGALASGSTNTMFYGVRFQNDSGVSISSLEITYTGEQWRTASGTPQVITFAFSQSAGDITDLTTGTYTNVPALDFTSPVNTTPASGIDGNNPANRQTLTASFLVSIPAGGEVMIRWADVDDTGTDHGAGIDDLRVVARSGTTAANSSMSGQVRNAEGRGIGRVRVMLSGGNLSQPLYTVTSPFGFYHFPDLETGQAYLLRVQSKSYVFENPERFISLGESLSNVDFVATP
ncbi:MAG: carboxypeptidase regulatory-like domain-containing protein [Acidobacteria bacterium]|nr:carboxypeptidase regulatory-like domain-containing protein [Acidobacteriota bacterium]